MVVTCHIGLNLEGGGFGVDIFFAISGFLITSLLLQEHDRTGRIGWGRFYLRRLVRLVPGLALMLAVCTVIVTAFDVAQRQYWLMTAGALFSLTPITRKVVAGDPIYNHTWSLGVEDYFYLLWPVALILFVVWRSRPVLLGRLTLIAGIALYGLYAASILRGHETGVLRVAGIAIGCAYGIWARSAPPPKRPGLLIAVGTLAIAAAFPLGQHPMLWWAASSVASVGTCLVIHSILASPNTIIARALSLPPIVFLGVVSYEIYLWHESFLQIYQRASGLPFAQWAWLVALLSIAVAIGANRAALPLQRRLRVRIASRSRPAGATTPNVPATTSP